MEEVTWMQVSAIVLGTAIGLCVASWIDQGKRNIAEIRDTLEDLTEAIQRVSDRVRVMEKRK